MKDPGQSKYLNEPNSEFWQAGDFEQKLMDRESPNSSLVLQNRWQLVEQLGQGGMGTVYKAYDLRLSNRLCVVKKLMIDFFREEDRNKALAFFEREKAVLSALKHPNIVLIHDYFEECGNYYLVMEYVEGENLQERLLQRGKPFSEAAVTKWASEICDVLVYLHSHNPPVIYRDLKPSNIMLDAADNIKLVDFGIARPYRENADNTHVVSGGYSPPEQYWGGADHRSDLYALGATMYFLLTGAEPLALQTSSPGKINSQLSEKIDRIVQRLTSQDVSLRYQSASQLQEALKNKISSQKLPNSIKVAGAVFCLLVLSVLGSFFLSQNNQKGTNTSKDSLGQSLAVDKTKNALAVERLHRLGRFPENKIRTKPTSSDGLPFNTSESNKSSGTSRTASSNAEVLPLREEANYQGLHALDLADVETRVEMLTDPEVLKQTEPESLP